MLLRLSLQELNEAESLLEQEMNFFGEEVASESIFVHGILQNAEKTCIDEGNMLYEQANGQIIEAKENYQANIEHGEVITINHRIIIDLN